MSTYTVTLDLSAIDAAPQQCPGCGAGGLVAIGEADEAEFHCRTCGQFWRFELGWASQIAHASDDDSTANEGPPSRTL